MGEYSTYQPLLDRRQAKVYAWSIRSTNWRYNVKLKNRVQKWKVNKTRKLDVGFSSPVQCEYNAPGKVHYCRLVATYRIGGYSIKISYWVVKHHIPRNLPHVITLETICTERSVLGHLVRPFISTAGTLSITWQVTLLMVNSLLYWLSPVVEILDILDEHLSNISTSTVRFSADIYYLIILDCPIWWPALELRQLVMNNSCLDIYCL